MPDSTTPPPDDSTPPKKPATPSGLNQAQIASLAKALDIAQAALDPVRVALLVESDGDPDPASDDWNITEASLNELIGDIQACQNTSTQATGATNEKKLITVEETDEEIDLVHEIQYFQSRAKQKFARKRPQLLPNYHIGHRIAGNRDNLEQYTRDIILHATADNLPGVDAARITGLGNKLAAWIDADKKQNKKQGDATDLRGSIRLQLESITDRRITVQYAADALFPYWDDKNYTVRRLFHLTLNRPFDG